MVVPTWRAPWIKRLGELPRLHALQLSSAGHEHALRFLPPGVARAAAVGVRNTATAQLALTLMLAAQRDLLDFVRGQPAGTWPRSTLAARAGDEHVDQVYAAASLPDLSPRADVVAITAPLTSVIRGAFGAQMRDLLPNDTLVEPRMARFVRSQLAAFAQTGVLPHVVATG